MPPAFEELLAVCSQAPVRRDVPVERLSAHQVEHLRAVRLAHPRVGDQLSKNARLGDMLLGYMRVSKADGSQVLDLQQDALLAAGVAAGHLYQDLASGQRDDRPGLAACLKALRRGDALVAKPGA